jgi:hypothetical protein
VAEGAVFFGYISFGQAKESNLLPGNPRLMNYSLHIASLEYHPLVPLGF